ncbi:NADH-quinone oxidoreductase subunit NuoH [Thermosulfuriphilus ammonigenes]|uniref:NADH-quinone oxidoreductase subunit H n=1 Tax=Thermosulfuriphilus ammonigenes TaxID=1936021 RepID=A0A6G7PT72_9BACT|nr:NADH-quinone oxidoreductase subunit NuoH [Thermosulfuriphilus ammonigenes]MBA2849171.1 NADH-quinone oxidoreductase subunit H [Thermosulfuriphilus ammonigenes]QIJ70787.1 NADH-quinone oxidoreductase subunit NuoH [Thermosulfuriphilus ammonigenes]
MNIEILIAAIKMVFIFAWTLTIAALMTWVERRGSGLIQNRLGPNRVGPFGLFQPLADAIKFFFKEDLIPLAADKILFLAAPFIFGLTAFAAYAVIPFGDKIVINGREIFLQVADVNIGFLYVLGLSSLAVYGLVIGGWASNNKYSTLGALRSTAQMVSYEVPIGLSLLAAVMVYSTFSLREIAEAQTGTILGFLPKWGIFLQPLGFLVYLVAAFAEANRLPFDLPETESEIVAGYHTEYGSMKLGLYLFGEYVNMYVLSAMITTVYLGSWHLPWIDLSQYLPPLLYGIVSFLIFFAKVAFFLWLFVWIRWTLPRFRWDQVMGLGWKALIPLALFNILITALVIQLTS